MLNHGENIMEIRTIELLNEIKALIQNEVPDRWLTIREVCQYSRMSDSSVRRAEKSGALKASRQTGRLLFRVSNVDRWLNG